MSENTEKKKSNIELAKELLAAKKSSNKKSKLTKDADSYKFSTKGDTKNHGGIKQFKKGSVNGS